MTGVQTCALPICGLEGYYTLTNEAKNKQLRVVFSGRIRTNNIYSRSSITTAVLSGKDNHVVIWQPAFLYYHFEEVNKWCFFKDSIDLPKNFNGESFTILNIFTNLGETKIEKFDIDTLFVEVKCRK